MYICSIHIFVYIYIYICLIQKRGKMESPANVLTGAPFPTVSGYLFLLAPFALPRHVLPS